MSIYKITPSSSQLATATVSGSVTSYAPEVQNRLLVTGSSYGMLDDDGYDTVHVSTVPGTTVVTLPTTPSNNPGRIITVRNTGTGTLIVGGGGATIDGDASIYLYQTNEAVTVICDGTNWYIQNANWFTTKGEAPTGAALTNLDAATFSDVIYIRTDKDTVQISGRCDFDPTVANVESSVEFTPSIIGTNGFLNASDAAGVGGTTAIDDLLRAALQANTGTNRLFLRAKSTGATGSFAILFTGSYVLNH